MKTSARHLSGLLASLRTPKAWICRNCARQNSFTWTRAIATQAARPTKPYYVTTPIFYVNAAPHVGHLYTLILADVMKRWHCLRGEQAILCTGTDEHGMKVQQAATKAGKEARRFCDEMHWPFKLLAEAAEIDYDHFIRTSEKEHYEAVQHFWSVLESRDLIYQKKHEGWYSVSDETFYTQNAVHLTLDPATGRKLMASIETGKEVEWTSEINYHFRMSQFRLQLLDHFKTNPDFIQPPARMRQIVQEVESGLEDLSISRPAERLQWGIPVPGDSSQTIYVWVDALINYLTKAGYPNQAPEQADAKGWPADCHVIGKDIIRFHAIYWPCLLIAAAQPLPRQILSHAHWTLGKRKMSKSTGMVVNPFFAIKRFGVDCMRWFLILNGGLQDDAAYDNASIIHKYKKGLQGGLGNLVRRLTHGKDWNISKAVNHCTSQRFTPSNKLDVNFTNCLRKLPESIQANMARPEPGDALAIIMNLIYDTNVYLQSTQPWNLKAETEQQRLHEVIYTASEAIRISAILLQPFMPSKMTELLDLLGVDKAKRLFEHTTYGSDPSYGTINRDSDDKLLFPVVSSHF